MLGQRAFGKQCQGKALARSSNSCLTLELLLLVLDDCLVEVAVALGVVCLAGLDVLLSEDARVLVVVSSCSCTLSLAAPADK